MDDVVDAGVVAAGLILAGTLIVLGALLSLGRRATFRRELAAVRTGTYPAWRGYARYRAITRRRGQVRNGIFLLALLAIVAFSVGLPQTSFGVTKVFDILTTPADDSVLLICFVTGLFFAATLSSLIVSATADAPAYRLLRGGTLRTSELVGQRLKLLVPVRLLLVFAFDICAVLFGIGVPWEICLALIFVAYIAANVVAIRTAGSMLHWYYPCVPLELGPWRAMAARVETWARQAGQPVPHVYVRSGPIEGYGNSAALGGSPGTLYLSDDFLASSEWRQQDALLCWLIVARAPLMRQTARVLATTMGLMVSVVAVLLASLAVLSAPINSASVVFVTSLLPILLIFAVLIGYLVLAARINRRARRILQDADRRAAELTGDPWAVMTMLATLDTLCLGTPALAGPTLSPVPARLAALDALTRLPGPRAPWAYQPVPSLQPVLAGPYPITVPLGTQIPVADGAAVRGG